MGKSCYKNDNIPVTQKFRQVLWIIIAINAVMFAVEFGSGVFAKSKALEADSLDFLGDTITYAITLFVLGHSVKVRAGAALVKGLSLGGFGLWILGTAIYRAFGDGLPTAEIMGGIAVLALTANMVSVLLLLKHREGDANIRSVWLCSRNDAIGNLAVIIAALAVKATNTFWPDVIVAIILASLFLHSAFLIIRQVQKEVRMRQTQLS